jgi:hypothetical protein
MGCEGVRAVGGDSSDAGNGSSSVAGRATEQGGEPWQRLLSRRTAVSAASGEGTASHDALFPSTTVARYLSQNAEFALRLEQSEQFRALATAFASLRLPRLFSETLVDFVKVVGAVATINAYCMLRQTSRPAHIDWSSIMASAMTPLPTAWDARLPFLGYLQSVQAKWTPANKAALHTAVPTVFTSISAMRSLGLRAQLTPQLATVMRRWKGVEAASAEEMRIQCLVFQSLLEELALPASSATAEAAPLSETTRQHRRRRQASPAMAKVGSECAEHVVTATTKAFSAMLVNTTEQSSLVARTHIHDMTRLAWYFRAQPLDGNGDVQLTRNLRDSSASLACTIAESSRVLEVEKSALRTSALRLLSEAKHQGACEVADSSADYPLAQRCLAAAQLAAANELVADPTSTGVSAALKAATQTGSSAALALLTCGVLQ